MQSIRMAVAGEQATLTVYGELVRETMLSGASALS
jgi:hypothetical protein